MVKKEQKVALIQGGLGDEREISLMSARCVAKALKQLKIPYQTLEADKNLPKKLILLKPKIAFLAVHGQYAEDGTLQGMLEYLKIPYTASGVLSSALCMDKCFFKDYISQHKIPTAKYQNLNFSKTDKISVEEKGYKSARDAVPRSARVADPAVPLVIKPAREGSTLGIHICKTKKEVLPALKKALKYDHKIVVESYIKGMEVAVSILEGKALTPLEIVPEKGFYDYKSKYKSPKTQYIIPARLDKKVLQQCKKIALKTAQVSHVRTYARVDFIVQNNTHPLVTEINTLPGLTTHSLFPKSAKQAGVDFNSLILKILNGARTDYL